MRKGMAKGTGKGYKNIMGMDSRIHSQSAKGIRQPQRINPILNKVPKKLTDRQIVNRNYEKYIIDAIDSEAYDVTTKTPEEKLRFLRKTFRSEYGFMIDRVGEQKAFEEWISGLPSTFNIEFNNHDILKLAKRMGSLPENATEKQEDRVLENYWNFMTVKTFQAFKKYKVDNKDKEKPQLHSLTIEPTSVPRGAGNNPNAGKRDSKYKIKEWGFIFSSKDEAEKYANEHVEENGTIVKRNN